MEIDLRLDSDGRTAYNPSNEKKNDNNNTSHNYNDNIASPSPPKTIDYRPKAVIISNLIPSLTTTTTTNNNDVKTNSDDNKITNDTCHHDDYDSKTSSSPSIPIPTKTTTTKSKLDELLYDCEIADCGILPRTFWMDVQSKPRCALEKLALSIFHHHISLASTPHNPSTTGVEWWVQIRPSPPSGRYSMHSSSSPNNGISFHWDKDEELRNLTGGSLFIHPHISTVTYLTDVGAPTMVVNRRVDQQSGRVLPSCEGGESSVLCSWPRGGKHLSFDGRFLHAAPVDVMREDDEFFSKNDETVVETEGERRRRRRVTFLVNLWVNYKPLGVEPFPEGMVGRLSPVDVMPDDAWGDGVKEEEVCDYAVGSNGNETEEGINGLLSSSSSKRPTTNNMRTFVWPLGSGCDSNENDDSIEMDLPIDVIQEQGRVETRGTVRIGWKNGSNKGVRIVNTMMGGEMTTAEATSSVGQVTGEHEDKKQRVDE